MSPATADVRVVRITTHAITPSAAACTRALRAIARRPVARRSASAASPSASEAATATESVVGCTVAPNANATAAPAIGAHWASSGLRSFSSGGERSASHASHSATSAIASCSE